MTTANPEQIQSVDRISELTQVHRTLDTPDVVKLLKELHKNAEPYAKKMLDSAITAAINHADSNHVAIAFKGFAEKIQTERKKTLDIALKELMEQFDFTNTATQA